MNKSHLHIAGILIASVIGTALVMHAKKSNQPSPILLKDETISHYDSVDGAYESASIRYTSYIPEFSENIVSLLENQTQTPDNVNIISYYIQTNKKDNFVISIDKDRKLVSFTGLTPKTKISVIQNSKYVLSNLPSDWSGKIVLNKDNLLIQNNMCFEFANQNITACHGVAKETGGVS